MARSGGRSARDHEERHPPARAAAAGPGRSPGPALEFMRSLWGLNHALESSSRRMKARLGVTGPERMVLRIVGTYPGISAGDLARFLQVHPSTLTALLKRLVARGLVVRGADAADARRALLTLTARGEAIDAVRTGTAEAGVRAALRTLSPSDVDVAMRVLDRVGRAIAR